MPNPPTSPAQTTSPPLAPRRPTELTAHGDVRIDDWYWLRERENPEILEYLEAENAYAKEALAHTEPLQEKLFEEIKSRIQETDESPPSRVCSTGSTAASTGRSTRPKRCCWTRT